jgi:succinate dehydrogenase/fumarate reductase flavoprotein subunit
LSTPVPSYASQGNITITTPIVNVQANKAVIVATGGVKSNVQLRTLFDPRLTEEYQASGEPWIFDSGDGIIAAQAIGAQLCSDHNLVEEWTTMRSALGCRYCITASFLPGDPVYPLLRASGFSIANYQDCILVKSSGLRFYDETSTDPDGTNADILDAALADGGGPIWAIFDSDAVAREKLNVTPPTVDPELFFSGNTIAALASSITVPADMFPVTSANFQPIPASVLEDTVTNYNSYVDAGKDPDFGKPSPKYKIQTPPFYAAWATPILHDTRGGLRINDKTQVLDINGQVIPGLYSGGEAVGGLSILGIVRAIIEGRIAATNAVAD